MINPNPTNHDSITSADPITPVTVPNKPEEKPLQEPLNRPPSPSSSSSKQEKTSTATNTRTPDSSIIAQTTTTTENQNVENVIIIPPSPKKEKHLRRKFDRVLMPLVFCSYLLAFLDRSNIGNASTAGMSSELNLTDGKFQWLLTVFYIPYIIFEVLAVMWKLVPPHIWAASTVMIWGLASTLQATATNWEGLMACRWFLAMAEAGFAPGVPYLLSFFYKRKELGLRIGVFLSAAPLATTFAGALAYGITSSHTTSISPWRLLFLVEGAPTLLLSVILFFYLPDSPDTAKFLTEEEKEIAKTRAILQSGKEGKARLGSLDTQEIFAAFESIQTVIPALMYFSCNVSFSSLPVFLPVILNSMGFDRIQAQGLTAPPYFLAFLICIASTWLGDRIQQRGYIIITLSVTAGIGYVLLATREEVSVRYIGVFLAAAGVFPAIANILPWTLNNQGSDTKRGIGIAILNIVGQCGPLLGTRLFGEEGKPFYFGGMGVCAGFMFFNAGLAGGLRWYFVGKNRGLEEVERGGGEGGEEGGMGEREGVRGYRYVL
ncbi:major facilitator superfamily transporter [Podospora fimiseda]|uniref:Major facilitator superfamily transporter n=1 Tax=Podospora fimiseda TaxID=252190 RepID=A0AAN7BZK7_9PEZI|nr:major facilitator superfamily transporter [Podospora fimiseda]